LAKALVTGGAGFVGSNVAQALVKDGIEVVVLDNFATSHFKNLTDIKCDIIPEDAAMVDWGKLPKFDIIFHQQAITDTTVMDQKWMMNQNTEAFRGLLKHVVKNKIPLVYASSAGVYGNQPPPHREDGSLVPENIYGFSKLQMDRLAQEAYPETKTTLVGLRYFNVFGPHERYKGHAASMIFQLAEQMQAGKRPRIFEFGEQKRDHIYVKDVVTANLCASHSNRRGVYNVGTGAATSFNRLIEIINEVLGTEYEPEYFKNPYGFYQNHTQATTELAEKEIGFKAKWSIEDGIRDYLTILYKLSKSPKKTARKI